MFAPAADDLRLVQPEHPFFPLEARIIGYLANDRSMLELLALFALSCATIIGVTLTIVNKYNSRLRGTDRAALVWFVFTGSIHLFFEGYFSYNHYHMPAQQDFFGQLWKEYAYSDSRYMTSDPFVLCMETVTAVCWGPLSFCVAYLIVSGNSYRYPLQLIVSLGQIYGDILYYSTSLFDLYYKGLIYCRPEPYYFWFYFVFMNFIWIVIPGILLYSSVRATGNAFRSLANASNGSVRNGPTKKLN